MTGFFRLATRLQPLAHNALRIAAGLMFMTHGGQKLFAWFGAEAPRVSPIEYGIAGVLEFFGGLAVALGALTQPIAFLLSGEMAVTYFWKHAAARESVWWWVNRGETPALFCFIFLFLWAYGAGSFSLDAWLKRRRAM